MADKQANLNPIEKDYAYIEYFRKSMMSDTDPSSKENKLQIVKFHVGRRDYFTQSLKQMNHLIQIDEKPNLELMEPKWELYKLSISFQKTETCKLYKIFT